MKICPECLERVDDEHNYCPEDGTELREIHPRDEDPMEGRVLEKKWLIESKIGGGGMGTVYRANQLSVDRTVAVKILRSDLCEDDAHVQRFFREANVASKVADPRCVTIYDFGQTAEDHILYLAMEFLEGRPLKDFLGGDGFSLAETVEIGIQIAAALETLHGQGVIHRDLKPENVFIVDEIGSDVFLKLLDFGLAKVASSDATPVTQSGQVFGTPEFMSPEQCMGSEVGPRSDLYSLGCLLYELVSGRTPFRSNVSVEVLLAHVNRDPPAIDANRVLPPAYKDLIMQLLEKDPSDRPESSVDVRERLERIREKLDATGSGSLIGRERVEIEERSPHSRDTVERGESGDSRTGREGDEPGEEAAPRAGVASSGARRAGPSGALVAAAAAAAVVGLVVAAYMGGLLDEGGAESAEVRQVASPAAPAEVRTSVGNARPVVERAVAAGRSTASATAASDRVGARALFLAGARTIRSSSETAAERSEGSGRERSGESTVEGTAVPQSDSRGASDDPGGSEAGTVPVLTKGTANRIFNAKNSEVLNCISSGASGDFSSVMTIQVELILGGTGAVRSVAIPKSDFSSQSVEACVVRAAHQWSFPPTPDGARMKLLHEFNYTPAELN